MRAIVSRGLQLQRSLLVAVHLFVALVSFGVSASPVPYLQSPTANSMWITWKTDAGEQSVVEFGLSENNLIQQVVGSHQVLANKYHYHSVQLTELQPDTRYFYRVKSGQLISSIYSFKTLPSAGSSSGHVRVLVMGDHQIRNENRYEKMVQAAKNKIEEKFGQAVEQSVNLILNDGDQVDVGTLDHYENLHFAQSAPLSPYLPIMTTVGNHEYYYDGDLANYQAHFIYDGLAYAGIPAASDESYYAYQVGRVLFIHLNSMRTDAQQESWLRQVITAAGSDNQIDWIISTIHHPYQAEQYVGDISKTLRESWMAILSSTPKHVLNIGGHHHLYARGQTRDWPTYHMISGGTAWDQYWGQSSEIDFDDVQKTIANWAWQLIDIDVERRTMTVETYGEAHPIRYKTEGFHLNSTLIDSFYRKLDGGKPATPVLQNQISAPIALPYTFISSQFATNQQDPLNSTQFQIADSRAFTNLQVDRIRDHENIFGDTGAPLYEPVDIHQGIDILSWEVPRFGLPNGSYFIRVRHRDQNMEWSDWSPALEFEVQGSTDGKPTLALDKLRYKTGDDVTVIHSGGYGNQKDWVGVFKKGDTPQTVKATQWQYVDGPSGEVRFAGLDQGEYFVAFFENDSYSEISERVNFYLGPVATLSSEKTHFSQGETVKITWQGSGAGDKDWLGIYKVGQTPGEVGSTQWQYATSEQGSASFSNLDKGYYYAAFLINDGYTEISERLQFSVGEEIATVTLDKQMFAVGEDIVVSFSGGPGIAKDYIGIFKQGATPGQTGSELVSYAYFDGAVSGQVVFDEEFSAGTYFLAMYTNDSYDQVSNRACFSVGQVNGCGQPSELTSDKAKYYEGQSITLSWRHTPGNAKDWVGIYKVGEEPGDNYATSWKYLPSNQGSLVFEELAIGDYFAVVMLSDGYQELTQRIAFSVSAKATLSASQSEYTKGQNVMLQWSNTPGNAKDWIGIYAVDHTPQDDTATVWQYLALEQGTAEFEGLDVGEYYAVIFLNDGYQELTQRITFKVIEVEIRGDFDRDGAVTLADSRVLRRYLGTCSDDEGYRQDIDLSGDGCINFYDYGLWFAIYRKQ